jgi:F0F1-type ATP synthase membrane subunit b/b'
MAFLRLRDGSGGQHAEPRPEIVDGGEAAAGAPWIARPDVREVRNVRWTLGRRDVERAQRDALSGSLLSLAGTVIAASAIGAGYVSYGSQKLFAIAHLAGADREHHRASIIAALPDAGWIAMALVGLVAALRGRSSLRARVGVLLFFGLSLAAQVMYAPKTPKGAWDTSALLVAVIAPIALAWMLESFVVEVRRWAAERRHLAIDEAPILSTAVRGLGRGVRAATRFPLWLVRLALAPKETGTGLRDWFLDEAPLAPGRTRASLRADEALARAGTAEEVAAQAKQQAAELVAQARREAAEQVAQRERDADAHVERVQAEAAEQLRRLRAEADAQIERLTSANADLSGQVDRLREQLETLAGKTTAKARLHALYEQLGRDGDPRYMDPTQVRPVANELASLAGMQSVGTADAYIREYIATKTGGSTPVKGRGTSSRGEMIVNGA